MMEEGTVSLESLKQERTLWLLLSNPLGEWHTQISKAAQIQILQVLFAPTQRLSVLPPSHMAVIAGDVVIVTEAAVTS